MNKEIKIAIESVQEKKAEDVTVLDLKSLTSVTDYFVICSGDSEPQLRSISRNLQDKMAAVGIKPDHIEGRPETGWILMEYDYFVVHIFLPEKRLYYELERLWADAPRVDIQDQRTPIAIAR